MGWTSPRTWVAAEKPPASTLNTHIRDNFKAIGDPWTAYAPTLSGWTLGNGTIAGFYVQMGKTVHFRLVLTTGSTTTYSAGPSFSLPATAFSGAGTNRDPVGTCSLFDTSASAHGHRIAALTGATTVAPVNTDGAALSPTVPWTWTTGDKIFVSGTYEAA